MIFGLFKALMEFSRRSRHKDEVEVLHGESGDQDIGERVLESAANLSSASVASEAPEDDAASALPGQPALSLDEVDSLEEAQRHKDALKKRLQGLRERRQKIVQDVSEDFHAVMDWIHQQLGEDDDSSSA
eukprot:TRINITY_DN62369_c0_g1_i1.p2 TRINITY_DN62369_c0_g1~~TRINITY_DN62369_c0_g1_i1.p2  ORF type:complete len:130 (+),score=38.14 TRINITY_DN62369_c0_g1_i1:80-469(+)